MGPEKGENRTIYSDGTTPPVTYSYDTAGRLATAANGTDTLTWAYDLAGQLLSEQSSKNSSTVAYTYDDAGSRLSVSLDGTLFVTYGYDDASRLTTITRGSNVFGFGYDNANRRTLMTYPNGVNTSYSYDNLNRLLSLSATMAPSTTITNFTYTNDAAGNRTSKALPDYTESYGYDSLYRLTQVQRTGGLTGLNTYSYDAVGNRLTNQQDSAVTTSSYNNKNQLTGSTGGGTMLWRGTLDKPGNVSFTSATVNGLPARMLAGNVFEANLPMQPGTNTVTVTARDTSGNVATKSYDVNIAGDGASYQYDANGNLTQKNDGTDTWGYFWNAENQLVKVQDNGVDVVSYAYDPTGRRVEKATSSSATYTYDGAAILRLTAGGGATKFVQGPGIDQPLASEDGPDALTFMSADALGTVTATTTGSGSLASTKRYDAWGEIQSGGLGAYGFTGREPDAETELVYYRARYYSPRLGRFISGDPIGIAGGLNAYVYADNRPVVLSDPEGLTPAAPKPSPTPTPAGLTPLTLFQIVQLVVTNNQSGLGDNLIICIIWAESGFRPGIVNAVTQATGLMQMTPIAAKQQGVAHNTMTNAAANIQAGTRHLSWWVTQAGGNVQTGLFNFGPRNAAYLQQVFECESCLNSTICVTGQNAHGCFR